MEKIDEMIEWWNSCEFYYKLKSGEKLVDVLQKEIEMIKKFRVTFYEKLAFDIRLAGLDKIAERNIEILNNRKYLEI